MRPEGYNNPENELPRKKITREDFDRSQRPSDEKMAEIKKNALEEEAKQISKITGKKIVAGNSADVQDMPEQKSDKGKTEVG